MTYSTSPVVPFLRCFDFDRLHFLTRPSVVVIDVDTRYDAAEHVGAHHVASQVNVSAIRSEALDGAAVLGRDLFPVPHRFP